MEFIADTILVDPNFLYLALLFGLWMGVTATHIPGTGLAELGAATLLIGSIMILTTVSTNWIAVVLMVAGIAGFLTIPFLNPKYSLLADMGLVLQAVGGFLLFNGMGVSPIIIAITIAAAWGYHHGILLPMLRTQQEQEAEDMGNDVLGEHGRVVKALDPIGTIYVNKELWRARSDEHLQPDMSVTVVGQQGLELIVEKAKRENGRY
ncbi:MAG: NfeD family protein [Aggregatilineales bacterium]